MRRLLVVLALGSIFVAGCAELLPNNPGPPTPHVSCSDIPDRAELENSEASQVEIELACLTKHHPEQERETMSYHPILGAVARARAVDLATNGMQSPHIDMRGYGPDWYICEAGYVLWNEGFCDQVVKPETNSTESLAIGGRSTAAHVLSAWYSSPGHRAHLLGSRPFNEAVDYGIGYAFDPERGDVWVFIAAAQGEGEQ